MGFLQTVTVLAGLSALLALGMTLVVRSGVYSIASSAFYLVGAYATAIGTTRSELPHLLVALLGACLSAFLGLACISPAARARDDQLLLLTLAFAEGIRQIAFSWQSLTKGAVGISGVPPLKVLGLTFQAGSFSFVSLVWCLTMMCALLISRLFRSPWGLRLDSCREDETVAASLGISASHYRYLCHAMGAFLASLAGSLYAHYLGYVSPAPFTIVLSVLVLAALVLGGLGDPIGAVIGAVIVSSLQPLLQLLGTSSFYAASIRQVIFGSLLALFIILRPSGLRFQTQRIRR